MRIAIDARPLNHPHTGIGRYTSELIQRLSKVPELKLFLYSNQPLKITLPKTVSCRTGKSTRALSSIFAQCLFPLWARRDGIDVFWSPRHHLPLLLRWLPHIRTMVTIHDLVWLKSPDAMRRGGRMIERLLMPASVALADRIIVVSKSTQSDLIAFDPRCNARTMVIPCGSSFPITHSSRPETPSLLFVGTFEPRKNIDALLTAFAQVRRRCSNIQLVLAGNPGWNLDIHALIEKHQLADSTNIVSLASDNALAELYRNCSMLILPSWYEGFGLPVVEAMCFGKPTIVAATSSLPEVAGAAGLQFPPDQPLELAAQINRLLDDDELYAHLATQAHQQARKFDWDKAAVLTHQSLELAGPNVNPAQ